MTALQPANRTARAVLQGVAAAVVFILAVATGFGSGMVLLHRPPDPYSLPGAAATYNIPTEDCAQRIQSRFASTAPPAAEAPQPVMIVPGLLTNDGFMSALAERLGAAGYRTYGWGQGFNLGIDARQAAMLSARLEKIYADNEGKKVSLVGYSLGGIYARELARRHPDMVKNVITLGAPVGMRHRNLDDVFIAFHPRAAALSRSEIFKRRHQPPPVPVTSVYSPDDRLVDWRFSLNPKAPLAENVPVRSLHLKMPFKRVPGRIVLDRLAEPPAAWRPLAAKICP